MEKKKKFYLSLKMRLLFLLFVIVIPLTFMVAGYQRMFENYSRSYNEIMANLKVANEYNIKFKSDMEYSMYRVMIGLIDVDKFENGDILEQVCYSGEKSPEHDCICPSCLWKVH